jgi:intracellular septation protein A
MYKRVIYENWADWVPYVAFGITALVFFSFVIRAITLRKDRADEMARLPLDD